MKFKHLFPLCAAVALGILLGKIFIDQYKDEAISVFYEGDTIYFIETNVYETLPDNINKDFVYQLEDNGYHEYIGMTKSKEIANNIKDYYKEKGNNCYVREKRVVNEDFISILNEYDKLLSSVSIEDIINIEKIILSNYKEMVIENYEN